MYCSECGKEISDKAVVCPLCGCATMKFNQDEKKNEPIIINNNNSASSAAASSAASSTGIGGRFRIRRSLLFDIIMILCTGGLWLIWMAIRPKYY